MVATCAMTGGGILTLFVQGTPIAEIELLFGALIT
jgi:hypothetical protein